MSETRTLYDLRQAADEALEAAKKNNQEIDGAINWGDLHVCEVGHVSTDENYDYYLIRIEEASPDANELQSFVRGYLGDRGWSKISVQTEW